MTISGKRVDGIFRNSVPFDSVAIEYDNRKEEIQTNKLTRKGFLGAVHTSGIKYCPNCDEIKDNLNFYRSNTTATGLTTYCKTCRRDMQSEYLRRDGVKKGRNDRAKAKRKAAKVKLEPLGNTLTRWIPGTLYSKDGVQ